MNNIYYFKPKTGNEDFYLRFDTDEVLYFKEREHSIFSALDIYKAIVNGVINDTTIYSKRFKVKDYVNDMLCKKSLEHLVVILKDKLEYFNDSTYLYVNIEDNEVMLNANKVTIEYLSQDSDRHSEKEKLDFIINLDNGICIHNSKYLLFLSYNLFSNYVVKKM